MGAGKLLAGVLAGFAIGAAIGILMAPDKGTETRKKYKKRTEDFTKDAKAKFNDIVENLTDVIENVKEKATEAADKLKEELVKPRKDTDTAQNN